jgi:nicotinic acid phosphoribosyltransferase
MPPNLQLLQVTLQALSSLAIAGGLLYTAVQFRHARKAQLVANFSKLVELQFQLRRIRVDRPDLASEQDTQNLRTEREIQQYFLNLMQLSLFEIAWYAHQQGQIADDYFHSWASRMWEVGREEAFRNMIANPSTKIMHDEFERYVRKLIAAPAALQ